MGNKDESKWKSDFSLTVRLKLRRPVLSLKWELEDPQRSWSDFNKRDTNTSALAKITLRGQTYWIRAMRITDGEAQLASLFAFGLLGASMGTETKLVMYRQEIRPGCMVYAGNYHVIDSHKDVKEMLAAA